MHPPMTAGEVTAAKVSRSGSRPAAHCAPQLQPTALHTAALSAAHTAAARSCPHVCTVPPRQLHCAAHCDSCTDFSDPHLNSMMLSCGTCDVVACPQANVVQANMLDSQTKPALLQLEVELTDDDEHSIAGKLLSL